MVAELVVLRISIHIIIIYL